MLTTMEARKHFVFFLFLSVAHAAVIPPESGVSAVVDVDVEMRIAGSADGKTFFAFKNNNSSLNWFEAREECKSMNMVLAEVTSVNQEAAIRNYSSSLQIWISDYWIGGRDSLQARQFSWDSTNTEFAFFNTFFFYLPAFATCMLLRPTVTDPFSYIYLSPCLSESRYWMCQV